MKPIETDDLTIHYNVKTCIHARECVMGLPKVFNPDARPWIQPDGADTDALVNVIKACPSGALSYTRKGGEDEAPPATNTLRLWENGPVEVHGDIRIEGHEPRKRALICRCGLTGNAPFCDNSHRGHFTATGVPGEQEDKALDASDGPLEIAPQENGPWMVKGNMEIIGQDGRRIGRMQKVFLCRCGASGNKPLCDGSHKKIGFTKPAKAED